MAKAINAFTGSSSRGIPEDYAQRDDGVWFSRYIAYNGYANAWTRWSKIRDDLSSKIKGDTLDYGFNPLRRMDHSRLRLPS